MDVEILKIVGGVAGIGGIAIGTLLLIYKDIIAKNIFPQLAADKAYSLLRLIIILVWTIAICGIGAWTYTTIALAPAPTPTGPTFRVAIFGPNGEPVSDAHLMPSVGTAWQGKDGQWQISLPITKKDTNVEVTAERAADHLTGHVDVKVTGEPVQDVRIELRKESDGTVEGCISDGNGHEVGGALVYVVGYSREAVTSNKHGEFKLPAHKPNNETVRVHASKKGFEDSDSDVQVGEGGPVTIRLIAK